MKRDLLRVVEAGYDDLADERAWLQGIADAARVLLDDGLGLFANVYQLAPRGESPKRTPFVTAGNVVDAKKRQRAIDRDSPPEVIEATFGRSQVATLNEVLGHPVDARLAPVNDQLAPYGARDAMGLVTVEPNGLGLSINVALRAPRILSPVFRERWLRVMAHLGAGLRLRRQTGDEEAVLDLSGQLHDAKGQAQEAESRSALRHAARAIDRARARRRSAPDEALAAWRALTEGRWSLVDRFESDGRHFLIARPNAPRPTVGARGLTAREACIVALAARGRSNKLIAYELGLSIGTVGTLLSRAARKLGVRSRAQLVIEWNTRARLAHEAAKETGSEATDRSPRLRRSPHRCSHR